MAKKSNHTFLSPQLFVFLVLLFIISVFLFQLKSSHRVLYSWTEIGPDTTLVARAVTTSDSCPLIQIDENQSQMQVRSKKQKNIEVTTCEYTIPKDAKSVQVGNKQLPVLPTRVKKILVIGDTGCRIKGDDAQNCNISKDWPFGQVAKVAALTNPDLIIHAGDFMYRQSPCPKGRPGCTDDAWGDTFPSFESDFLKPASPLLAKAPWVMARGNHEACNRSGNIWDAFLSVHPKSDECIQFEEPYTISFKNINFVVIDTSSADDFVSSSKQNEIFSKQFSALPQMNDPLWLVSHRPLFAVMVEKNDDVGKSDATEAIPQDVNPLLLRYESGITPEQNVIGLNATLQESIPENLKNSLGLVISGHIHNFEALSFAGEVPPQLAVGNSGTKLQHKITVPLEGLMVDGNVITDSLFLHEFGFVVLEEVMDKVWKVQVHDIQGNIIKTCDLKNREILCK